jgi:hypothetical protein
MARPRIADGGDGFNVWRVTTNVLNNQSQTVDKRWSSSLDVEPGANNSSPKNTIMFRNVTQDFGIERILWSDLGKKKKRKGLS